MHASLILEQPIQGLKVEPAGAGAPVYEREGRVGGVARTERCDGFQFDHAGHLLHLRTGYGKALVASLFPEEAFLAMDRRRSEERV